MSKTVIETDQAKIWIEDVNAELEAVDAVLKQVAEALEVDPEDDILYEYQRVGKNLKAYWDALGKCFKQATEEVKGAIQDAEEFGKDVIDWIKEGASKLGL